MTARPPGSGGGADRPARRRRQQHRRCPSRPARSGRRAGHGTGAGCRRGRAAAAEPGRRMTATAVLRDSES